MFYFVLCGVCCTIWYVSTQKGMFSESFNENDPSESCKKKTKNSELAVREELAIIENVDTETDDSDKIDMSESSNN